MILKDRAQSFVVKQTRLLDKNWGQRSAEYHLLELLVYSLEVLRQIFFVRRRLPRVHDECDQTPPNASFLRASRFA